MKVKLFTHGARDRPRAFSFSGGDMRAMEFFKVSEVARLLRVKKGYVYELVAQGEIKALRLSKNRIRIPEEALREFVEKTVRGDTAARG